MDRLCRVLARKQRRSTAEPTSPLLCVRGGQLDLGSLLHAEYHSARIACASRLACSGCVSSESAALHVMPSSCAVCASPRAEIPLTPTQSTPRFTAHALRGLHCLLASLLVLCSTIAFAMPTNCVVSRISQIVVMRERRHAGSVTHAARRHQSDRES